MAKKINTFLIICLIVNLVFLILLPAIQCSTSSSSSSLSTKPAVVSCKELNQWNCYSAKNEGYFCNSKDQTETETRWYYNKGHCKKFAYNGFNGNRNRFCNKQTCLKRCQGE